MEVKTRYSKLKILVLLHGLLGVYSLSGVFSKLAAQTEFLSVEFCLCYSIVIGLLGVYAIGWQQIIKRLPLTLAFSNKGVTVIWGLIWGCMIFHEKLTAGKLIGAAIVLIGIIIFAKAE